MLKNIKLILKSIREYRIYAIITPLLMVGEVSMEVLMPFTMSKILDNLEISEN